jgi:two-component system cell cycle sensor histidine kinase/response regulator CckA
MPQNTVPNPSPTVLVVDDEEPIRQVARRILEEGGCHVTDVSNGLDAVALLDGGMALDLLMADLDMPELRGDVMVQRIRATRPDLRVLYVTGNIDSLMDERPLLWDGEAFLEKPFNKAGLLEAVSLILYGTLKMKTS